MVHVVTMQVHTEAEFIQYLKEVSFYHYLLWFTSRIVNGVRRTGFVHGVPKIVVLPWIPLDRLPDAKKYKHNIRITLRTYIVLGKYGSSDAILGACDVGQLEDMMRQRIPDMPKHIAKLWAKAQTRQKREQ